MKNTITIARDKNDEQIKHISEVKNGLSCTCVCLECSSKLIAANKGKIQIHHFRHQNNSLCKGAPETGLHLLAKSIIEESNYINLDWNKKFDYTKYKSEKKLKNIIPDIQITNEYNELWIIEMFVTHIVDQEKLAKIRALNLNCLEIDLSNVDRHISKENLKKIIIDEIDRKRILNQTIIEEEAIKDLKKKKPIKQKTKEISFDLSHVLILIGLFLLDKYLLKKQ
jgi:hypothetical protein